MEIHEPTTEREFNAYYELRYRILRKPWGQPPGNEKDDREAESIHIIAKEGDRIVGIGRLHLNSSEEAQIRYMAVEEDYRGKGVGKAMLTELEDKARKKKAKYIVLNSRETAVPFYGKFSYTIVGKAPTLFGVVHHFKMRKGL